MYQAIEFSKPNHLTIRDVLNMNVGDTIDVIIWDRNFEEYGIWDTRESGVSYNPNDFFKGNHHQITYQGNMEWDIHFDFGETVRHPINLDVSSLNTKWKWIPIEDVSTDAVKNTVESKRLNWEQFPTNTRVGWRGPIMLWDKVKDMGPIYYITP